MSRIELLCRWAIAPALVAGLLSGTAAGPLLAQRAGPEGPRLVIRSDDMGFSQAANEANRRLLASGLIVNVSVLFCAPWYREAVEILRRHPEVTVGVHLCANAEWKNFRWGPVADRGRVPSLVDEEGHFWGSYRQLNLDRTPRVEELEIEFRAQIERALRSGLTITYLDNHMGAGLRTPEQRAMVQRLAREYGLVHSGSFAEANVESFIGGGFREQLARLVGRLGALEPDSLYLLVMHVGLDTPELRAMEDLNEGGVANMSEQRQWELDMLLSSEFRAALEAHRVRLVSYRELAAEPRSAPRQQPGRAGRER
jgi:chitin disaccharide deacetylase